METAEIDSSDHPDQLRRLLDIMSKLRSPDGCPWDREQSVHSLKRFLVEETYEVIDAIESGNPEKHCEELGDLLLQIVFQSQICSESGQFSFDDVAASISDKLVRRHPHVFGDTTVSGADEVLQNWDRIKKGERGKDPAGSILDGVPRHLPALQRAYEVQKRASRTGFDWGSVSPVLDKVEEELGELRTDLEKNNDIGIQEELGDLLFSIVNLARFMKYDPEELLRKTVCKFSDRFKYVESRASQEGRDLSDCTLEEMDVWWEEAKEKAGDARNI